MTTMVALAAAGLLALGGCTADGSRQAAPVASAAAAALANDPTPKSPQEQYASGELTFADPADAGYAPVTDLPTAPAPTPSTVTIPDPAAVLSPLPTVQAVPDKDALSQVKPLDLAPAAGTVPTARDGVTRNDQGEPMTLDEAAGRACGNAEIALRSMDDDEPTIAAKHAASAAEAAAASNTAGIATWAPTLKAADPTAGNLTPLIGFLSACAAGGYEL